MVPADLSVLVCLLPSPLCPDSPHPVLSSGSSSDVQEAFGGTGQGEIGAPSSHLPSPVLEVGADVNSAMTALCLAPSLLMNPVVYSGELRERGRQSWL